MPEDTRRLDLLETENLQQLLAQHRRRLNEIEQSLAYYAAGQAPAHLKLDREDAQEDIAAIEAELTSRGASLSPDPAPVPLPGRPASIQRSTGGCPFIVGRPLDKDDPIFGREQQLCSVANDLKRKQSITIVGKRELGKTSFLNHLIGNGYKYGLPTPPYLIARVNLRGDIRSAERFYGTAIYQLTNAIPPLIQLPEYLTVLRNRVVMNSEASYQEFKYVLRYLRGEGGLCTYPILALDDFEELIKHCEAGGFPLPAFFENLRALNTEESLLSFAVTAQQPLPDIFKSLPPQFTSRFPGELIDYDLEPLDPPAADALLSQACDHPLTPAEIQQARTAAEGKPLLLQMAGRVWYETKAAGRPMTEASKRFEEQKKRYQRD